MSIIKYEALLETVHRRSLTRAAEVLGYTQPGISHMITSLESQFGFPLLRRKRGGVEPTAEAEQLLATLAQIVAGERKLQALVAQITGLEAGSIRVGCYYSVSVNWMPELIKAFELKYPGIEFELFEGTLEDVDRWLIDGTVDIGFISTPTPSGFDFIPLHVDPVMAIMPKDHPLAGRAQVGLEALCAYPFILSDDEDEVKLTFTASGLTPQVKYRVRGDKAIAAMVEHGLGVSLAYELVLTGIPPDVAIRPIDGDYTRTLGLALRPLADAPPAVKAFIAVVEIYFGPDPV